MGGAWLLDGLWRKLGIGTSIRDAATGSKRDAVGVERLLFTLAQGALAPGSKLAALEGANGDRLAPGGARAGVDDVGEDPQVFCRAMDFLLDADRPAGGCPPPATRSTGCGPSARG